MKSFLLNPGTWLLALWSVAIVASIFLYIFKGRHSNIHIIAWIALTLAALIIVIVVFIVLANIVTNARMRPSNVDVSPIAVLNEERVLQVEDALFKLVDNELMDLSQPRVEEFPEHGRLVRRINMGHRDEWARLRVSVTVYRDEDQAVSAMQSHRNMNDRVDRLFSENLNANNTEAVLRYPFMPTSASGLYLPAIERVIISHVRFGSVILEFRETRQWYDMEDDLTSRFIALLVEEMQD